MKQNIQRELAILEGMTATQLRGRYRELFEEDSRSGNRQWLFRDLCRDSHWAQVILLPGQTNGRYRIRTSGYPYLEYLRQRRQAI